MTNGRWRITVATPDWGPGHLSLDAIVAYVDDELDHGPYVRATRHLAQCRECAAQVVAQGQARAALRTAEVPSLPSSLLTSLRSIPQEADLPAPPTGLAVTADGQLVSVLRPEQAASLVQEPPAGTGGHDAHAHHDRRHRRRRIGTGVAVSGLAAGAIALALPAALGPQEPVPTTNGVLGDTVGAGGGAAQVVDARMQLPSGPETVAEPLPTWELDRLEQMPGSFVGLHP